jgi:hypothetical protein
MRGAFENPSIINRMAGAFSINGVNTWHVVQASKEIACHVATRDFLPFDRAISAHPATWSFVGSIVIRIGDPNRLREDGFPQGIAGREPFTHRGNPGAIFGRSLIPSCPFLCQCCPLG